MVEVGEFAVQAELVQVAAGRLDPSGVGNRWLGPNVGPRRLLATARGPGVAWPSVDGLEHGWPGSVGVVGAECHLFAGLVLGALHVEFHADSPVGVAAENQPVAGFV